MKKNNIVWGVLLIALGALFLADKFYHLDIVSMAKLWPLFVLIPGLLFESGYFISRGDPGLLVPGGMFTTAGAYFLVATLFFPYLFSIMWPIFPLSVAVGLFQLYIFGSREAAILIPVAILGGVSLIAFSSMVSRDFFPGFILPGILILAGLLILVKGFRK
jgi:hypothetical protein